MTSNKTKIMEDDFNTFKNFLKKNKNNHNGLILNFGDEKLPITISMKRNKDKVYLRKEFTNYLIDKILTI